MATFHLVEDISKAGYHIEGSANMHKVLSIPGVMGSERGRGIDIRLEGGIAPTSIAV